MSPEQCLSEALDRRSDVFGLGIVLYELTTCSRLFAAENDYQNMNQIVEGRIPPPGDRVEGYPEELAAIVMKALAANREQRYASALDLRIDLERFARRYDLVTTNVKLGDYMRRIFPADPKEWEAPVREVSSIELPGVADVEPSVAADVEPSVVSDVEPSTAATRLRRRGAWVAGGLAVTAALALVVALTATSRRTDIAASASDAPASEHTPVVEHSIDPLSLSPRLPVAPAASKAKPEKKTQPRVAAAEPRAQRPAKRSKRSRRSSPIGRDRVATTSAWRAPLQVAAVEGTGHVVGEARAAAGTEIVVGVARGQGVGVGADQRLVDAVSVVSLEGDVALEIGGAALFTQLESVEDAAALGWQQFAGHGLAFVARRVAPGAPARAQYVDGAVALGEPRRQELVDGLSFVGLRVARVAAD
jgi:hypothetical protein